MKLSDANAELFYELMWNLQIYVNQQLKLVPHIDDLQGYEDRPMEEKILVREALYEHPELIDRFIAENPRHFSPDQLDILKSWKNFVSGSFYLERYLKQHAIFISDQDVVYAVLGLRDRFDNIIHKSNLPLLVKAVLLPFKGQIIYDGLLQGANVFFGGGIKGSLKQVYLAAKSRGQILESLDPNQPKPTTKAPQKPSKDFAPLLDELAQQAKALRGGHGQPPINGPIFSLIKASLELGQTAVNNPDDEQQLMKSLDKIERALRKVDSSLGGPFGWRL
ncbi:MAG TPA: hypothetical protein VLS96_14620 [Nodosilinea sp.]|nr:hypothetical protein [Nodosilinea sp.]